MTDFVDAPGRPGIPPTWTSSAKTGVGTALSALSRVSFTLSHGILNEVYYPRIDEACIRDCGLIVTDGHGYLSEEKRDTIGTVEQIADGVPGYRLHNRSHDGRYTIEKRVVADPERDAVLQHIRFEAHTPGDYRVFVLLAPHLVNAGAHNTAWVETIKGLAHALRDRARGHARHGGVTPVQGDLGRLRGRKRRLHPPAPALLPRRHLRPGR